MYNRLACFWHRWFGWCPIQFCMICGRCYWGGWPWFDWQPSWSDYCSRKCADIDLENFDKEW